jgi:MICOS complex subunit MIC12
LWETVKDRWNAELERNVRKLQTTDWDKVREDLEERVSSVWRRAFKEGREKAAEAAEAVGKS